MTLTWKRASIGLALLALAGTASLARADETADAPKPARSCFQSSQWQGWKSPKPDVIYLGVNLHDVYRVDLSYGSPMLKWGDSHLVNIVRGSSLICAPIDLDLKVSNGHGFVEPLFVSALTKLTPDEVAAIPKEFRP